MIKRKPLYISDQVGTTQRDRETMIDKVYFESFITGRRHST